ncbi:uncharacterized protein LOC131244679 [Magnolia sinica]|uniref:uncharacterized protein LOC131244679 n=1 Tax=Magnolia sinica TaxID=86752 RepID=UPI002658DD72|nr:uncharacterized protein LOC131244679 [Magnolia sinica]
MWRSGDRKMLAGKELPQARTWKLGPSTPSKDMEKQVPTRMDSFHAIHKLPTGDSPYVRAKHVQLVDKDPNKAISLFWAAINIGDRVNSALKDMAIVMKQVDRAEEAIEAVKSFRHLCSTDAQESLDNVLLDLYKRCNRVDEQIVLLEHKLKLIEDGLAFGGKKTKIARSQGKKFHVSIDQERARLLGNLAWAYIQQEKYHTAEALYRKALCIEPDKNKQCNLAICLMQTGRISEARSLLERIQPSSLDSDKRGPDSYMKSFERACEMLAGLECQSMNGAIGTKIQRSSSASSITGILNSPGSGGAKKNCGLQVQKELMEAEMQWSSCSSTLSRILNSTGPISGYQNHGTGIETELIKTEIRRSSSSSALNGILNSPAPINRNQSHGKIASGNRNRWRDGDYGEEIRFPDNVFGNLRWENDGDDGKMLHSPPPVMGNLDSSAYINQNQNHRVLGSGGSRWGNDSDEEQLFSDEKMNSYDTPNRLPTSNDGSLYAGAYPWVGNNGVEEEGFADENLNSNLPTELPTTKCIADSSPILIRGHLKTTIPAPRTTHSQSAIVGNWRGADGLPVLTRGNSKHPSQELLSTQSSIDGDWRQRADDLPVPVQGNLNHPTQELPITQSQSSNSSPVLLPANSKLLPQQYTAAHLPPSVDEDWRRRAGIPCNSNGRRSADCAAEKRPDVVNNLNPCGPSEPVLVVNPQAGTAFQKPSGGLPASSTAGNSNCMPGISVIGSRRQADCNEKQAFEVVGSPLAIRISRTLEPQNMIGRFPGSVNGNLTHKSDVSVIGSRRWADMVEEEEEVDKLSTSITGNLKVAHHPSAFSCGKTWAEMVDEEEEEEALAISKLNLEADGKQMTRPISQWGNSWNDMFPDENLNANIMRCIPPRPSIQSPSVLPPPQKHQELLQDYNFSQQKLVTVNLKEGLETPPYSTPNETPPYSTPNTDNDASSHQRKSLFSAGLDRNPSARRSLSFEPQQKQDPKPDYSSTLTKIFDVDDYSYLQAIGSGSKRRGNRLRVFQEMTLPDSPRA